MSTRVFALLLAFVFIASGAKIEIDEPLSLSCDVCVVGLDLLQDLINANTSLKDIEKAIVKFCVDFKVEAKEVCKGLVTELTPEVVPIVTYGELSSREICKLTGFCNSSSVDDAYRPIRPQLIEKAKKALERSTDDFFYILQLSDIHFDPFYKEGTDANCNLPLCCREINGPGNAGKWGEPKCDIPLRTFESMLEFIGTLETQPSFIVITGDNTPHDIWNQTQDYILSRLKNVSDMLNQAFPSIPIYPTLGNHDTYPIDQFSIHNIDKAHHDDFTWLRDALSVYWSRDLDSQAIQSVQEGSHYSIEVMPGLRLVALNTEYGDTWNFYLLLNDGQVSNETAWLIDILTAARAAGEKVILFGHIPTNFAFTLNAWAIEYIEIVNEFSDVIVGQFFGHTHDDSFSIVKDLQEAPVSVMYIAPSVTSFPSRYPSFRLYQVDSSSFEIIDYFQYYGNFTFANENDYMHWNLTYQASVEYSLPDLSAKSWNDLISRFENDDSLFQTWYLNTRAGYASKDCTDKCKLKEICEMQNALPICNL